MSQFEGTLWIRFTLQSDGAFGRGDGVAGLVDAEVQHDQFGLPFLNGKTLKGLLAAECSEVLYALKQVDLSTISDWESAASFLFGQPGSRASDIGRMIVGNAQLPEDLQTWVRNDFRLLANAEKGKMRRANLESLTTLRRQTAVDHKSGASKDNSLRTIRAITRGVTFTARLAFTEPVSERACWLLAASVQAFHRAGTGRNRGYGRLKAQLYDSPSAIEPISWFDAFANEVQS